MYMIYPQYGMHSALITCLQRFYQISYRKAKFAST